MKKIIVCVALSIISILCAVVSFVSNDIGSYRAWMMDSKPQIMQRFDKDHGPEHKQDKHHDDKHHDDRHDDKHDKHDRHDRDDKRGPQDNRQAPPPAPAPAPAPQQAPAPDAGNN